MLIYLTAYILLCIALAWYNKKLIFAGKRIYHGVNGLFHIAVAVGGVLLFGWLMWFIVLLIGRVTFDTALSLFRGLGIDYVPYKPKSIVDKFEKKLFGYNGILPKVIYLALAVGLMVIK